MSTYTLPAGAAKQIYVDRKAVSIGNPPWVIRCAGYSGSLQPQTLHAKDFVVRMSPEHSGVSTHGSKYAPLTPEGPALWLETTAEIEVWP